MGWRICQSVSGIPIAEWGENLPEADFRSKVGQHIEKLISVWKTGWRP